MDMTKRFYLSLLIFFFLLSFFCNSLAYSQATGSDDAITASGGTILEKLVFFGDSTTHGLIRYNVENNGVHGINYHTLKRSQIWTTPEGTFYLGNLLSTTVRLEDETTLPLQDACRKYKPQYLVITVGINGLRTWTEADFTRYYDKLISMVQEASPQTQVILQSVFPVAKVRDSRLSEFTPDRINTLNLWIRSIAASNSIPFLNTAAALTDNDGFLCSEYHNGDGLHLNTKGYNAILKYIENNYNVVYNS